MFDFLFRKVGDMPYKRSRLATRDVTDTIAHAMEHADEMKTVVILYETKEGVEHPGGMIIQEDITVSKVSWMLDVGCSQAVDFGLDSPNGNSAFHPRC